MAAYAALVSLSKILDDLLHHHNDQYPIPLHEKQQIISVHEYILSLQAFLEDFPEKATSLEGRIRDVANEAEDKIEYFMSEHIRPYYISRLNARKFLHHLRGLFMWLQGKKCGIYTKLRLHFNLKEFTEVAREVMEIKSSTRTKDVQLSEYSSAATSSSRLIAPTCKDGALVGFDDDLMAIKLRLCGESQNLEFIPIFGMGGIGKTTLARSSFNDPLALDHFDIRAWVTVSQDYTTQEIFSNLLDSIETERSARSVEPTVQNVYQRLKGRRYLVVLDDIWSTKAWDHAKMAFPDDHNGSRIILTTRQSDVAAYPDPFTHIHEMHFMDVDQSWNLLQQKVFPQENCPPELETIGKTIARSCGGLPLAIVLIAGLLSTVRETQDSWENIAKTIKLAIRNINDEQFARILSLSYTYLPHHLRPCFLYMGGFPEDHEIYASKLIKLWVAEGFSKTSGSKSFEEVAEEYLEDLVKRSLIMVTRRKSNDKIKSCSMHDLIRDLCIRKAKEEKFLLNVQHAGKVLLESRKNERRITITHSNRVCLKNIYGSSIRTIICFHHDGSSLRPFGNSRLLRVLDVAPKEIGETTVSSKVFELFHLRYLAFTCRTQFVLPPSILNLQNLQTLIIRPPNRCCLPMEIWKMRQLRHLIFKGPLPNIPEEAATFPLENLQTLSEVENFNCTEEILKMIPNLKTLGIYHRTDSEEYVEDYHLNSLVNLYQLEKLTLTEHLYCSLARKLNPVFPSTLKELNMWGQIISWKDMGIVGSLPNLQVLKLKNYQFFEDKWETREGEFSQLKFLRIERAHFQHWITESSHFPSLKCLVLYYCDGLSEIPDGIGEIPTLELIQIGWNKSLLDSAKKLQEKQAEYSGDTTFQVCDGWAEDWD